MRAALAVGMLVMVRAGPAEAQDALAAVPPPVVAPMEATALHEQAVFSTVHIVTPSAAGTGWLLAQSGRPLVVTNRQLAESVDRRGARVLFYAGADRAPVEIQATRASLSGRIDLGLLALAADPPPSARVLRPVLGGGPRRGERVILGGGTVDSFNGSPLPFQTTEGLVTGQASGRDFVPCGGEQSCVVIDAAFFAGTSGGPAFDARGQFVGMLWGGPRQGRMSGGTPARIHPNPSLGYLIPAQTIAADLAQVERAAAVAAAAPPALPSTPPQNEVATVLQSVRARVAACGTRGTVRVGLHVHGATGEVTRIELDPGTPFDSPTGRCVRTAVGALRFPRFSRDTFQVRFPYALGRPGN